jgi:hypothetical protein
MTNWKVYFKLKKGRISGSTEWKETRKESGNKNEIKINFKSKFENKIFSDFENINLKGNSSFHHHKKVFISSL